MFTKFVRFVAALAVIVSIAANTGVVRADRGAPPSLSSQNLDAATLPLVAAQRPRRAPEPQPLDIPALNIPPASSLGVQFVHVATAANILVHSTVIDHPLTNGNPNAIILVTPNWNPGGVGGTYDNHNIGVFYDGSKWRIYNEDGAAMPVGAAFNVIIPTPGTNAFVHTTTSIGSYATQIDNALTNGHPNAIVLVTPNYDKTGGVCGCVNSNFPIGVRYFGGKWAIFNQNGGVILTNASFNVFVLTAGAGVFVHTATGVNTGGWLTIIDNALTNGNPDAIVFVTPDWNPGGVAVGTDNQHNISVYYNTLADKWAIFNQDHAAMPLNAAFNVLVLVPASDIFVHTAAAGNISGDYTKIDSALTNGHPNAIVFTTPNWNPGGVGGTYDNHNIGVFYRTSASQWAIYNQDGAAMPANAAFNMLVPNPDTRVFVHKSTLANIYDGYLTTIDYPLTNGNPNAIILVTLNNNPGGIGGTGDNRPISVYYDGGNSKWAIFNQDHVAMPVNAAFNVFVPTAGAGVFVHTATVANTNDTLTTIDNALTNGNPNAIILVTPNFNPGGVGGHLDNHPIGVTYDGSKWVIFNQDSGVIPVGAAFNVYVFANRKIYLPLVIR